MCQHLPSFITPQWFCAPHPCCCVHKHLTYLNALHQLYIENGVARTILLKPILQDFEVAKRKMVSGAMVSLGLPALCDSCVRNECLKTLSLCASNHALVVAHMSSC
jgi:hypothetical protein